MLPTNYQIRLVDPTQYEAIIAICRLVYPTETPYTVAEYKNIAGRAGRLGLTDIGRSVLIVRGDVDTRRRWDGYVTASPEDLHSQLLDVRQDLYTLVLRVVAVATRRDGDGDLTEDDVLAFLANSLAAHQHRTIAAADPLSRKDSATRRPARPAPTMTTFTGQDPIQVATAYPTP